MFRSYCWDQDFAGALQAMIRSQASVNMRIHRSFNTPGWWSREVHTCRISISALCDHDAKGDAQRQGIKQGLCQNPHNGLDQISPLHHDQIDHQCNMPDGLQHRKAAQASCVRGAGTVQESRQRPRPDQSTVSCSNRSSMQHARWVEHRRAAQASCVRGARKAAWPLSRLCFVLLSAIRLN